MGVTRVRELMRIWVGEAVRWIFDRVLGSGRRVMGCGTYSSYHVFNFANVLFRP